MKYKSDKIIKYFQSNNGVVRFSQLKKDGFRPDVLRSFEKKGEIVKRGKGLYHLTNYSLGAYPDYVMASLQIPSGVICLISALYFHKATSEIPSFVDIAIPSGARANKVKHPPIKFYHFSPDTWKSGVEEYRIAGHNIRVYSLAKTIADCFKFRNKIGMDVARDAIKVAVTEHNIEPTEIIHFAKICRVDQIVKPVLETII
jgi:predicted transcriptional regulator of viral defense system